MKIINPDLKTLDDLLFKSIAENSKYKSFLTDEEFNKNYGKIMLTNSLIQMLDKKLENNNNK